MKDLRFLCEDVLRGLKTSGARYADIRVSTTTEEDVKVRNGSVDAIESSVDRALGVRVLVGDGWGFAADSEVSEESLKRAATRALEVARASHIASSMKVAFHEAQAHVVSWATPYEIDPWSIPSDRKVEFLLGVTEPMRSDDRIHQVMGEISSYRLHKYFASTDGSFIEQTSTEMGAGIEAIALSGDEFQRRNFPNAMGGDYKAAGWEFVEALDLPKNALRTRDEALALLAAPKAPAGRHDLIIGSSQLALQVHESCGHPTELDRALGWEISLAGGSFLKPDMLGAFRYGAARVNLTADATIPQSIGSFAFDDDGIPAQRFHLIENGVFVNYLTGRDTAPVVGKTSNGTVRAESAARIPIIRMTNINLEPGDTPLEELIANTKKGIFVDTNKSWSIDDLRLNFQFSCEVGWEIENGKLGRLLKNPIYTGNTPDFWNRCAAIGDRSSWKLWGLPNCGKGEPMQTMRVAHGAPAALFHNVEML